MRLHNHIRILAYPVRTFHKIFHIPGYVMLVSYMLPAGAFSEHSYACNMCGFSGDIHVCYI